MLLPALAIALTACGSSDNVDNGDADPVRVNDVLKVPVAGSDDTIVYDVVLPDGTRCVVTDGYKSGGVDCDWK